MDPCIFPNKTNPADSSLTCTETFTSRMDAKNGGGDSSSSDDDNDDDGGGGGIFGNMLSIHSTHNKKNNSGKYKTFQQNCNSRRRRKKKATREFNMKNLMNDVSKLPDDVYVKAFYIFMTAFSLYVFYRFTKRISSSR